MIDKQRLLARFLRYVTIDTTAKEGAAGYPSSPGQIELGKGLVEELRAMGASDAQQDEHGIVLATIPASGAARAPTIAWCAHLDTSPETSGAGVRPQVIDNYQGSDIPLPGDPTRVIRAADCPELRDLIGRTLVTTDGTTLLGADDKAGVAVIMEAAAWLMEHRQHRCGPIRLAFTCDEEIGRGVDHLPPARVGAVACYTLDGQGANEIDVETFSADLAVVAFRGVNIHPSIAKGRMVNAVRAAGDFLHRLPRNHCSPESTEGREGFLHPYQIQGGVAAAEVRVLLRDFDTQCLSQHADLLRAAAASTMAEFRGLQIEVRVTPQYRNMAQGLVGEPRAVAFAEEALRRLRRQPKRAIVRGGTDGSRLTEQGLPTPNLSAGQHTPHSPLEWACLDEMVLAVEGLISLAGVWSEATAEGGGVS